MPPFICLEFAPKLRLCSGVAARVNLASLSAAIITSKDATGSRFRCFLIFMRWTTPGDIPLYADTKLVSFLRHNICKK